MKKSRKIASNKTFPDFAALDTAWFITSIIGVIISVGFIWQYSISWAVAFTVVFGAMFFASMRAMRYGMPEGQLLPRPKRIR